MKKEIIVRKVLDNRITKVENASFEACRDPDSEIPEGECERCKKYHSFTYEMCSRGEIIEVSKPLDELLGEALDIAIKEGAEP